MSLLVLTAFYFLAAISIWLGLISLRGGIRFARYLRSELVRDYSEFTPLVSVFVPCRGVDEGLKENVVAIFSQEYPFFEVIFVVDRVDDPAVEIIEAVRGSFARDHGPSIRIVMAGVATDTGQKVHNLRVAVAEADPKSDVFVFVDTDAQPEKTWLQHLVRPLRDDQLGATTGYRWFVPLHGGFAAYLRSVWNASIASALGASEEKNFCWGGSTAIRRTTFEGLRVSECWRGTVSDDFTLTNVLQRAGRPIKFVPQCLTPSYESCGLGELFEFTTRQLKITRTYAPHLWRAVLIGSVIFVLTVGSGIALIIARALSGRSFGLPLLLLVVILSLGAVKSCLRLGVVAEVIPNARMRSAGMTLAHVILWPLASLLYLFNALAAMSRQITWRGITYELKSPTETVIIRH